jgi:hypothetical protein
LTSYRQSEANVANSKASTGPRSEAGKARSSKNALRHGLNVSIWDDAALISRAEELALRIAGPKADAETLIRARAIAEAQFTLERVRTRRMRLLQEPQGPPLSDLKYRLQLIEAMDGYESNEPTRYDVKIVPKALSPPLVEQDQRLIDILDGRKLEFARLERYERRALSRRKSAIRSFDDRRRT